MKTVVLFIVLAIASCLTFATTHYVDNSVIANGSGTMASPWKNLSDIKNILMGDSILFKCGGTWNSTLTPLSGADGAYVTYGTYGTGNKPAMIGFNANGKSYAKAVGLSFASSATVINLTSANHIIIDNCSITGTATTWAPGIQFQSNSNFNQIINNTITYIGTGAQNDLINMRGNCAHNYFYNNMITINNVHAALDMEGATGGGVVNYNIIKNNYFLGTGAAGALINLATASNYNVVEGNILTGDATTGGYCGVNPSSNALHEDMFKLLSSNNLVRFNIIKNYPCANSLGITMEAYFNIIENHAIGTHVYNNIVTGIGPGGAALYLGSSDNTGTVHDNYFKNNALYNNGGILLNFNINGSGNGQWSDALYAQHKLQANPGVVYNNYFRNNLFYSPSSISVIRANNTDFTTTTAQTWNSTLYNSNIQVAPNFNGNYSPIAGSPTIDAGTFLTITSASGSGTQLVVGDAWYFSDGRGILSGDTIQIGNNIRTITAINYSTNTITVNSSVTWTQGMYVSLPYHGSAPDIGVYEYQEGATQANFADKNQNPAFIISPNPFNPMTSITFTLPEATRVRISIFNANGEYVKNLANGKFNAGRHTVAWNGRASDGKTVSSGVYVVRMETGKTVLNKRICFAR